MNQKILQAMGVEAMGATYEDMKDFIDNSRRIITHFKEKTKFTEDQAKEFLKTAVENTAL